jgi:hypothetical protein
VCGFGFKALSMYVMKALLCQRTALPTAAATATLDQGHCAYHYRTTRCAGCGWWNVRSNALSIPSYAGCSCPARPCAARLLAHISISPGRRRSILILDRRESKPRSCRSAVSPSAVVELVYSCRRIAGTLLECALLLDQILLPQVRIVVAHVQYWCE